MLSPGTPVDRYEVVSTIAGGGMGMVYRVRHAALGGEYAMKVLLPNFASSEKVRARFKQEAVVQSRLQHAGIVHVFDLVHQDDLFAMVMDLVRGPSLESVINEERPGPWPVLNTMAVLGPVLSALAFAHRQGIAHRDLKPANVVLDRSSAEWPGQPRLTDFGLAKVLSSQQGMTSAGAMMGTLPYMAPEQYRGHTHVDARADVFSCGMLIWRMVTGYLPVNPGDMVAVGDLYTGRQSIPRLDQLGLPIAGGLADAVAACLALDPTARPADGGEVTRLLAQLGVMRASGASAPAQGDSQSWPPAAPDSAPASKPRARAGSPSSWSADGETGQTSPSSTVEKRTFLGLPTLAALPVGLLVGIAAVGFMVSMWGGENLATVGATPADAPSAEAAAVAQKLAAGKAAIANRRWDEAAAIYEEAKGLDPLHREPLRALSIVAKEKRNEARFKRGESAFAAKRHADAIREHQKVSEESVYHGDARAALSSLAALLELQGDSACKAGKRTRCKERYQLAMSTGQARASLEKKYQDVLAVEKAGPKKNKKAVAEAPLRKAAPPTAKPAAIAPKSKPSPTLRAPKIATSKPQPKRATRKIDLDF